MIPRLTSLCIFIYFVISFISIGHTRLAQYDTIQCERGKTCGCSFSSSWPIKEVELRDSMLILEVPISLTMPASSSPQSELRPIAMPLSFTTEEVRRAIKSIQSMKRINKTDYIHPCNDTSSECLIKATQDAIVMFVKGIPDLGVPPLDPFTIHDLPLNLPGIRASFHQGKATGFRTCIVDNVTSDLYKKKFGLEIHCNLTIKGRYKAIGRLMLFPIDGAGDSKVKLTNLRIKLAINTKYIKDDNGEIYFDIKDYTYDFNYGDHVSFDLKNLFKESKELSDTMSKFINENSMVLVQEFGDPIVDYAVNLTVATVGKFFHKVPCRELINVPIPYQ